MYVPQLPTDNLYKFLALSGVALMIACQFFLFSSVRALSTQIIDTQTRTQVLQVESSALEKDVSQLRNDGTDELKNVKALREKNLQLRIKVIQLNGEAHKGMELASQTRQVLVWSVIASLIGLIMSFCGFILWYLRVQKPADALVIQQLNKGT